MLCFCLWYPLFDPSIAKLCPLLLLPLIVYKCKNGTPLLIFSLLTLLSLFLASTYSNVYIYYEAIFFIFVYLGVNYPHTKLNHCILITSTLALAFFIAQKYQLLPYIWQQPILLLNYEFVDSSFTFPSFFGNPSPMCLFFVIATYTLKSQSYLQKAIFLLLCWPMIILSDSSIGIFLFLFSTAYLYLDKYLVKVFLLGGIFIPLFIGVFYPQIIQRPFQTRSPLYTLALSNLSLLGNGPGDFHLKSGELKGENTTKFHLTRNQFHPHNDLIFYVYSYGILGLLLRILLYSLVLYMVLKNLQKAPLLLFLLQIQFSPDALSLPAALLFFFFLGQTIVTTGLLNHHLIQRLSESFDFLNKMDWLNATLKSTHYLLLTFFLYQLINYSMSFQNTVNTKQPTQNPNKYFSSPAFDYNLGVSLLKQTKIKEAEMVFLKLQKISPHFQDLDYLLGHIYYSQLDLQKAKNSLEMKLKIDPYHVYTYLFLADIFVELGNKSSAIKTIKRGLLCLPKDNLLIKRSLSLE